MRKKIQAWAVVDREILKKDGLVFNQMFNASTECFNRAIFDHKENADAYANRLRKGGYKTLVVPCEVIYTFPKKI